MTTMIKQGLGVEEVKSVASRNAQLDFLRGVAVLLVLFCHLPMLFPVNKELGIISPLVNIGWSGVDLFFVLSGFLVSGLLFKEHKKTGNIDVRRFLIRRGFKIYPAFYLYMAICLPIFAIIKVAISKYDVLSELLFFQNYTGAIHAFLWQHTWSLAVEEHFYIGLAICMWLMVIKLKRIQYVPVLCLFLMALCLVLRYFQHDNPVWTFRYTHLKMDSLAFGVLISYFYTFQPARIKNLLSQPWFIPVVFILLCVGLSQPLSRNMFAYVAGGTFTYLGYGGVLIKTIQMNWKPSILWNWISNVGLYSYSIYLWHTLVLLILHCTLSAFPNSVEAFIYLVAAVGFGICMAKLVECPMILLRDKIVR